MARPTLTPSANIPPEASDLHAQLEAQRVALAAAELRIAELAAREDTYRASLALAEQQRRNLEILGQVRAALANQTELEGVFRAAVEAVYTAFGYALVSLYLRAGDELLLQHQAGYSVPLPRIPLGMGVSGRVVRSGQPVLLHDVRADPDFLTNVDDVLSEICLPIRDEGQVVGVLNVETTGAMALTETDLALLLDVCEHLAIAVGRARVYAEGRRERDFSDALLDTVESLVIVVDRAGQIVRFNKACERATGYTFEEVRGRRFWDLLVQAERQGPVRDSFTASAGELVAGGSEHAWVTRDGRHRLIAWSNAVLRDAHHAVEYVIGTGIDITERRQAERELRESEATLRGFYDSTPFLMGVFELVDDDLVYVAINRVGAERFGVPQDQVAGQRLSALLVPDQLAMWLHHCRASAASGRAVSFEYERQFGAKTHWRLATVAPIEGSPPGRTRFAYMVHDLTERRQAELATRTSSMRLTALIGSLQAGVLVENQNRQIVLTNQAFCRMFSIPALPEHLIGADCTNSAEESKVMFADPAGFVVRVGEILRERRIVVAEELALADGRTYERDYVPIMLDGVYAGHLWQYRDISERKQVEAALATARDAALESSRLKSEFLATVSHEIRTPLNGVIGMTELLLATQLAPDQEQLARTADTSAQVLLSIINDILDYSKIEAGKLILDPDDVVLAELLGSVLEIMRPQVREKQLALVTELGAGVPPVVRADPGRMRQILINLVGNAVKFTERGRVVVRVALAEPAPGGPALRVTVSDTGVGIAAEALARLFQPFVQADGTVTRRYGGTGLGLAICRSLVELMGGRIGCDSVLGEGSTFWFEVPLLAAAGAPQRQPAAAPHEATRSGHVLLAEDNPVNQQIAVRQLAQLGYTVEVAADGTAALELLTRDGARFQLVLMDCHMPRMDGYTCARAIRAVEGVRGGRVPIIAMTASAQQQDREASLAAGMDDFLSKPVRLAALGEMLDRWLRPDAAPGAPSIAAIELDADMLGDLRALDAGEPGLLAELIGVFIEESAAHAVRLSAARDARDTVALARSAHTLRGSAAYLGARALAERCADLETRIGAGQLAGLDAAVDEIVATVAATARRLASEIGA